MPNKPPYAEKLEPADSAVFSIGQPVVIKVKAYDVDGELVHVIFRAPGAAEFIDTESPYEFTWQTAGQKDGIHKVQVEAVDNKEEPYIIEVPITLIGAALANAGRDTVFTDARLTYVLQANVPASGTGSWTIISGTGGQLSDANNPNATLTGQNCQTYVLRWTVNNGYSTGSDEVSVTFSFQPSKANAGVDQDVVDKTTATLQAVSPSAGTGSWSLISGGTGSFSDASNPVAVFTGTQCGTYKLVWSVATPCAISTDTVQIRFDQLLTNPNAGPDQIYTDGRTSTTLAANMAVNGKGTWSVVSGVNGSFSNVNDPLATFTGKLCQNYILRWTIAGTCSSKNDQVNVHFNHVPTDAMAGADQVVSGQTRTVELQANAPTSGAGAWSIISGTGGSFEDSKNPTTRFTGSACQVYTLRWTITTQCGSSSDQVVIEFRDPPSQAQAGPDQKLTDGSVYVQLNAETPTNGDGHWSVVSGGTGSFSDPADPKAIFTGVLCHAYVLRWTVSTACGTSSDDVNIVLNQVELAANAGPDVRISDGSLVVKLQANKPRPGMTGTWSILAGSGGYVAEASDNESLFTGTDGQIYILKWTLSGACIENSDDVRIAFISSTAFTDPRDGITYSSVKLGSQVWMAENLRFNASGSYAFNNDNDLAVTYGRLYEWTAATTACPAGWHLPTDLEWRQMEIFLGMDTGTAQLEWYRGYEEGGMLKEAGTVHWDLPNAGANNLTGFTAIPGGYRSPGGVYGGLRSHAGFWANSVNSQQLAAYRTLHKDKSQIARNFYEKGYGFSVRCVKN